MIRKKRRYGARVKDTTGKLRGGKFYRVRTQTNKRGQWGTRAGAQAALDKALAGNPHLVGHTFDELVTAKPRWQDWLEGDVLDPRSVPAKYRDDYIDTLDRTAAAAADYGHSVYVSDSFRPLAVQQQRWETYLAGGPLAAQPGTSDHERGLSLDIPNARSTPKLIRALRKHGMIDDVSSEQWHVTNMARKRG